MGNRRIAITRSCSSRTWRSIWVIAFRNRSSVSALWAVESIDWAITISLTRLNRASIFSVATRMLCDSVFWALTGEVLGVVVALGVLDDTGCTAAVVVSEEPEVAAVESDASGSICTVAPSALSSRIARRMAGSKAVATTISHEP